MGKDYDHNDMQEVFRALENCEFYLTSPGRIELVNRAFAKTDDDLRRIRPGLEYEGAARYVATNTLVNLHRFGRLTTGEQALEAYLRTAVEMIDEKDDDQESRRALAGFLAKYNPDIIQE